MACWATRVRWRANRGGDVMNGAGLLGSDCPKLHLPQALLRVLASPDDRVTSAADPLSPERKHMRSRMARWLNASALRPKPPLRTLPGIAATTEQGQAEL